MEQTQKSRPCVCRVGSVVGTEGWVTGEESWKIENRRMMMKRMMIRRKHLIAFGCPA